MFSVSNILCEQTSGNEHLRYRTPDAMTSPRPVVVWAVTRACNLRCVHCYAAAGADPSPHELTHEEGRALLKDLADFGVPAILFSGGEPLVRSDTLELMQVARELGLNVTLSTNGLLITDAVAKRLAAIDVRYVGISLDGLRPTHDKLRGKVGAFDQAVAAIRQCQTQGIKVGVRLTMHALNFDQLDAIIDFCEEESIDRLCVYHLAYAGRGGQMQKCDLTSTQTRQAMDRLFRRAKDIHKAGHRLEILTVANHADAAYAITKIDQVDPVAAGVTHDRLRRNGGNRSGSHIASIDPTGHVHYDQFSWHYDCGNVRDASFRDIWESPVDPRLQILRERTAHLPQRCQACRFLDVCNGNLRTRAEAASGDWMGHDPGCYLTDAEIGQA